MRTKHIPGGVFADCLTDGTWVASVGATVVRGHYEGDGDDLRPPVSMLFNVLSPHGFIASKSSSPGTVFTYVDRWADSGIDSPGTQGHAWRPDGALVILRGGPDQESNGLRYWDLNQALGGNLDRFGETPGWVTGSPTYGPGAFARAEGCSRLYEWTKLAPGIFVGQGDHGGTVIQHPRFGHRLLVDGDSRFVRGHFDGRTVAVAVSRLAQGDAWCFWLTEDEIATLPVYPVAAPDPEPEPDPKPEPKPKPEPEPTPMYEPIPSHLSVVEEVWNRCTPEQRARHAFVAEAVAWELRRRGLDFYVNQKRGVEGDSEDAISTPHPHGAGGWAIIDVVAGMGGDNPQPAWIDVTQATIDGGTVGGGRLPRNVLGVGGDDGDPGDENDTPPPPAVHEALSKVLAHLTDAGVAILAGQRALREVKFPDPPAHECPPPPPCERSHDGVELQPYEEALALGRAIDDAVDLRKLGGEAFAHLMARFYGRSHTAEQIVEEARLRVRGEWRDQW